MVSKSRLGNPYIITIAYYLGCVCLGMATAMLGPTLQILAKNTGSTLAQISVLFSSSSLGYLLGSYASGKLYDRIKGHPILCLVLLILSAMMFTVPLSKSLILLQVLFFVIGIVESILDVGTNTLLVWLHTDRVPPFMNGLHAFYGIGATIAPLIVAAVIKNSGSLNAIYWSLAIVMLPAGLLMLILHSPTQVQANPQAGDLKSISPVILLMMLVFFTFTGAELGFGGWIYTFTTSQVYGNPTLAASINAVFWASLTVGRLIAIPIAIRLQSHKILWINFSGIIASLLLIIFFSSAEALLWIGAIGTGLFMASTFPTLLNYAQSRMHLSGKITSLFFVGSSLGSMAIPWLMGQLIGPLGATSTMIIALGSILLASVTFFWLNVRRHAAPLPRLNI